MYLWIVKRHFIWYGIYGVTRPRRALMKAGVRILQGDSIAFDVKISLQQESVSSPLLFVIFMNVTRALL